MSEKQHYTYEYDMYELGMTYSLKSFSAFDSPIKALVVALSYIDELEDMYECKVNEVNIYDKNGCRKYTVLL